MECEPKGGGDPRVGVSRWLAVGPTLPVRRSPFSRWLLLAGVVLVGASGFRLAEPTFDALRGKDGTGIAVQTADVPLPEPAVPTAGVPGLGLPAAVPVAPVVVITDPTRVRIPRIGVDAAITHLGLNPDSTIGVPKQWGEVGWYDRGPAPGGIGPAILVGHYDSTTGPAVFYRLRELVPGDRVEVASPTGATQSFTVDRAEDVSKSAFPTQRVYGPVTRPELRLITCGGSFDEKTKHYRNNLVVYAHADGSEGIAPAPAPASAPGVTPAAGPAPVAGSTPTPTPAPAPASARASGPVPASVPAPGPGLGLGVGARPAGVGPAGVGPAGVGSVVGAQPPAGGGAPAPPPGPAPAAPIPAAPIPAGPIPAGPIPAGPVPAAPAPPGLAQTGPAPSGAVPPVAPAP